MYCQKCGFKLEEGDKFCQKCGAKIDWEEEKESIILEENISTKKEHKNNTDTIAKKEPKTKKIILIVAIFSIIAVLAIGFLFTNKSVDLSIQEYLDLRNNDQLNEYKGYELKIKGYLFRDTRTNTNEQDGYYGLINESDVINGSSENFDMVMFIYSNNIEEDVGSGSEVIITATMQKDTDTLLASNVEILKKVEPIYTVEIEDILKNQEKYDNKKVIFSGRMVNLFGQGQVVTDANADNIIKIDGLTEKDFGKYIQDGSMGSIIGVFKNTKEAPVIVIEDVKHGAKLLDYADLLGKSVKDCYYDYSLFDGIEVSVYGKYETNFSFSNPTVLCDLNSGQFIALTTTMGVNLNDYLVSGKDYVLTGILREGGTGYILEVLAIG